AVLTRLAEAIFSHGDRVPSWLARKLAREGMRADLSRVAVRPGASEHVPYDMLLGYFLVGHDPDDEVAHSAGFGVIAGAQGRGIGRALVEAAAAGLARAGLQRLRVLAEPGPEAYFAARGFLRRADRLTLMAPGTSSISHREIDLELAAHPPLPWLPAPTPADALELCAWRPGAWARTDPGLAATLQPLPGAWAHVSREGRALLVQRLLVSAPA